MERLYKIIQRL